MNRFIDRLLAMLLLAIGMLCFTRVYFALGGGGVGEGFASARLAFFAAAGVVSALAALLFWAGLLPGRSTHDPKVPLFGRGAETQPGGRPRLRRLFTVVPFLAVLALVADQLSPWSRQPQDAGKSLIAEQAVPSAPESQEVTSAPAPKPEAAPASPSEVALAPPVSPPEPAPAPAAPPQTVAPLPQAPPPQPTQPDGHREPVVWLAVAPDGHSIMSASTDRTIKLWDIDGKRLIRTLGIHKDMARTALFLPDGARALTAGDDGEIVLRQLADGAVLHVFSSGQNGGVNKLAISPDGKRAVSGHDTGRVIVWDIEKGSVQHVMPGHDWSISGVAVSPDGTRAISGSIEGTLKLWDIDAGKQLRSWHGHERGPYGVVFTADGRHLITGSGDYTIKLWDLDSGREVRRLEGHSGTVYALALSTDGKRLLSGSLDGTARLWDMETGSETALFDSRSGPIYAVAFAADGTVLTGGYDRTIRDWPAGGGDGVVLFAGAPE
ncbi:MAG: WD40 repeat domain-containing protein [Mesorhizobium sp.]|uniref:WD40 repeat domain-containing protein n=1 Tax=Mesorhizobium sp. TaxID=1871066 RepID=UPI0011F6C4CD|nr:WD40 repeat domain-containing protein [Mesorhizobium sp.]TIL73390.1 MAG: WD40 repeat domain-containing protein [Mesorhizobium sp.]TIL86979.1 MAG: WD40 repeat domain-containing protein [Mesorhizobium sp.]TIL97960.1 MAG: WD40 repeat domain-containing protein [Mesorhizobium sp.]